MASFTEYMSARKERGESKYGMQGRSRQGGATTRTPGSRVRTPRSAFTGVQSKPEPSREPAPEKAEEKTTKEGPVRGAEGLEGGPAGDPSLGAEDYAAKGPSGRSKLGEHLVGGAFSGWKAKTNLGLALVGNVARLNALGLTGMTLANAGLISTIMNPSNLLAPMAINAYKQHQATKEFAKNLTDEEMGELADVMNNPNRDFESLSDKVKSTYDRITNNQRHLGKRKTHFDPFAKPGRQTTVTKSQREKDIEAASAFGPEKEQNVAASGPEARFNKLKENRITQEQEKEIREANEAFDKAQEEKRDKAKADFRKKEKELAFGRDAGGLGSDQSGNRSDRSAGEVDSGGHDF
jgi:hypothetical protein